MTVPASPRSPMRWILAGAIVLASLVAAAIIVARAPSAALPVRSVESMFQDDDHLIYASTATVTRTLDTLRGLGVQRVRATVLWRAIAPDPRATTPPAGFDASSPAAYPASSWAPYDRLVQLAGARGIAVDFNVGAPAPLWAVARGAPTEHYAAVWMPSPARFAQFVTALGIRYSGHFPGAHGLALPRVSFWSIWNEPNQPGWLAPQWGPGAVMEAPALYRQYVDAAFGALRRSGHGPTGDTILIGGLAPEGGENPRRSYREPIPPMPFVRALYCVDAGYRPLTGAAAASLGCPRSGSAPAFVAAHPGLFDATGFAHHPYSFFLAPGASVPDPNFVPLSDLARLEDGLDLIFATYGVARRLPLYLTEYGYETNPPNPYRGVTPAQQAAYLNEAEYMAWSDPRVRAMSEFLLYDAPPDTRYPRGSQRYWSTFQTGLLYADGAAKPALDAYRMPVFVADPVLGADGTVTVWGRVRPASPGTAPTAQIQWQPPGGSFRTVATVTARGPGHFLEARVRLPGAGALRIAWRTPAGPLLTSRVVAIGGR